MPNARLFYGGIKRGVEFSFLGLCKLFPSSPAAMSSRRRRADEVNVLAISLFGEIDGNVQRIISEWLFSNKNSDSHDAPLIDAVLLATRESRRRSSSDKQLRNEKAKLIKSHFWGPDAEDESFFFVFDVPYKIPGLPV